MSGKEVKAGDCISIFWDGDQEWYYGQIMSYDEASHTCQVLYDDGEKEDVNLNVENYKIHTKKDSARKVLPTVSSANNQWKFLEKTLFDIADRLPYKGVHAAKEDWWEKWKIKVSSASVSKNVALMSFSILEISRQLKTNLSTIWWIAEKRAWEKEVVDAKTSRQLAFSVNELLTKAVDWARARQLFDSSSFRRGNLIQSVSKLESSKPAAITKEKTGQGDVDVTLDKADYPASPRSSVRKTRRNREQAVKIHYKSKSSKKSRQATNIESGLVGLIPFVDNEVITEKQESLTEVLLCKLTAEDFKDKNHSTNVESLGVEDGDNSSYKISQMGNLNVDVPIKESLQEVTVDSFVQLESALVQNIDKKAQNGDPSETSDSHPDLYGKREMQVQLNMELGVVSNFQVGAKIPQEFLASALQNSLHEETYEFMKSRYDQDRDFMKTYKSMQNEKSTGKKATALPNSDYSIKDGFLFFQNKLCVVMDEDFRQKLIHQCHISSGNEHLDSDVTSQLLETSFFWPKMRKDVQKFVGSCATCLDPIKKAVGNQNLLADPEVPNRPWQSVILTLVNEIPCSSEGHSCILVFVDRMSKLAHFVACKKMITAVEMAHIYFMDIVRLHGFPKFILSDNVSIFKNDFWISMWKMFGATIDFNLIELAEKDSDVGKVSKLLENLLKAYVASQQQQWQENLHLVEFVYNNSISTSTGFSPFKSIYGYDFPVPSPLPVSTKQTDGVSEFVTSTINLLSVIESNFSQLSEKREITIGLPDAENAQNGEQSFPSKDITSSGQASIQHARKRKYSRFAKA